MYRISMVAGAMILLWSFILCSLLAALRSFEVIKATNYLFVYRRYKSPNLMRRSVLLPVCLS